MLVKQTVDNLQTGGLGQGNDFTIASSAKAFEILSSNLYQNKPLAVIRELSCNAADAHKAVKRPLSAIQIHLPTFTSPEFWVRDYGPGLSKEDVLHLYTTYFQSSKDNSNEYIGGLGLGSKSPFAVADQFSVISWHGGFKRQYICYKKDGVPAINLVTEQPSTEDNGMEVRVAVPSANFTQWANEAANFFRWWPEVPSGITIYNRILTKENTVLVSPDTINGLPLWEFNSAIIAPTVLMGLVPYALNFTPLLQRLPAEVGKTLTSTSLLLRFGIGEVEINPSRETLSYNPSTVDAICARLANIYKTLQTTIDDSLKNASTLYEARCLTYGGGANKSTNLLSLSKIINAHSYHSQKFIPKWKGKAVEQTVELNCDKAFPPIKGPNPSNPAVMVNLPSYTISTTERYSRRKTWQHGRLYNDIRHTISNHTKDAIIIYVWAPAITSKTYRIVEHHLESIATPNTQWGQSVYPTMHAIILSGPAFADVEKAATEAGFLPFIDITTLPDPPKNTTTRNRTNVTKTTGYIFTGSSYNRTESEIDLTIPSFYLQFYNGNPSGNADISYLTFLAANLHTPARSVFGFTKAKLEQKSIQKSFAANNWTKLTTGLTANLPDTFISDFFYADALQAKIGDYRDYYPRLLNVLAPLTTKHPSNSDLAAIALMHKRYNTHQPHLNQASTLTSHLTATQKTLKTAAATAAQADVNKLGDFIKSSYPMLNVIDFSRLQAQGPDKSVNLLLSYIK